MQVATTTFQPRVSANVLAGTVLSPLPAVFEPRISANVLAGTVLSPLPAIFEITDAEIFFPNFQFALPASLVEISPAIDSRQVTIKLAIDESLLMVCIFNRGISFDKLSESSETTVYFRTLARPGIDSTRIDFITSSLLALLWMSGSVRLRVPTLGGDIHLTFAAPLNQISDVLRNRHLAYQLMVIERAFNVSLTEALFSPTVPADQIAFGFHAITDRSFDWPFIQGLFVAERTDSFLSSESEQPGDCRFNISAYDLELLDKNLPLGKAIVLIENAVIANLEDIRREMENPAQKQFQLVVRSLSGKANFEFPDAPHLPINAWDNLVSELISLERQFIDGLFTAVNELAAGSLADLTEEEKAEVTARPEFV